MLDAMFEWMEQTWIANLMVSYTWSFPIAEAIHFFGLCLLMGSIAVMDLRLLGIGRGMSFRTVHQFVPIAWIGFAINAITGLMFFFTQPTFYWPNPAFRIKMVLILLAGINALWFQFSASRELDALADDADAPGRLRAIAGSSLVLWIAVICFGRFIMYWPPF